MLKKITVPEIFVRMWVADVPLDLKNDVEKKRRKMRLNKKTAMTIMMELFLASEGKPSNE